MLTLRDRGCMPGMITLIVLLSGCQSESKETETPSTPEAHAKVETPSEPAAEGMVWIPGGVFLMGTDSPESYERERPAHRVKVDGFWMDAHEVTNAQFAEFVAATGYQTVAERVPTKAEIMAQLPPGTAEPHDSVLVAGSLCFDPPEGRVPLDDISRWWTWTPGANWRHPDGPDSEITGKEDYPVVHVAIADAEAYCQWAGKRLPTEAEYEFALKGGTEHQTFSWGEDLKLHGKYMANTFQGLFPFMDTGEDGFKGIAPVQQFPPNPYGLYDIVGNCWEWTSDWYNENYYQEVAKKGLAINPKGAESYYDPAEPYSPKHITKGGSYLCANDYCVNYRATARQGTSYDSGASHIGFRCVKDQ